MAYSGAYRYCWQRIGLYEKWHQLREKQDGQAILETQQMQGEIAETWIDFLSNVQEDASDSAYAGTVNMSETHQL